VERQVSKNELRCFCRQTPLLAVYGIEDGKLFVHVKIYKARRIFGEILVTEGKVKLRCRDCLRWHTVRLQTPNTAVLEEDTGPVVLPIEA